jgi:hypothetical protein
LARRLAAARHYRQRGWSVFPVEPRGKRPLIEWKWLQHELPHADAVEAWWDYQFPGANIGLVTGAISGVIVFDIDGPDGLSALTRAFSPAPVRPLLAVRTPRGQHLYFPHPGRCVIPNRASYLPKVDVRGDGGYVVLPPSRHPSGQLYVWEKGP